MPKKYVVRLLLDVEAKDPADAVQQFIHQLNEFGLRPWWYTVEELGFTDFVWHVTGRGEVEMIRVEDLDPV